MKFIWHLPVATARTDEGRLLDSDVENNLQVTFSLRGKIPVQAFRETQFSTGEFTAYTDPLCQQLFSLNCKAGKNCEMG